MDALEEEYAECARCPTMVDTGWWTRGHIVFGEGAANADISVFGIAPGEQEDETGLPFIGPTGQLLDDLLLRACPYKELDPYRVERNLNRGEWREVRQILVEKERLFYSNVTLCRPVKQEYNDRKDVMELRNRDPSKVEYDNCAERLRETLYINDPFLVIALGGVALTALMALDERVARSKKFSVLDLLGEVLELQIPGVIRPVRYPLLVLPHPAFLLRKWDPRERRGFVQRTQQGLKRGLRIVDTARHETMGTAVPERTEKKRR